MKKLRLWIVVLLLSSFLFLPMGIASDVPFANVPFDVTNIPEPAPPPKEVRDFFDLSPFYQQWINVYGFPVIASANVSPHAVKETAWLVGQMLGDRQDILEAMAHNRIRHSIIAHNEMTSDIPELEKHFVPHFFYNVRNRGGYCPKCLTVFAEEESLLNNHVFSVMIHEMAHALHEAGLNTIEPTFETRLKTAYRAAMEKRLWQGFYAASNFSEYWAEGAGSWFHAHSSNAVNTRAEIKAYDPDLASLLAEIFGDGVWRYTPPPTRTHLPHLRGFDPRSAPQTIWPPGVLEAYEELRNPNINERNEWINLSPYDPSLISILNESRTIGDRTDILFVNLSGAEILLYWVFPDGTETLARRSHPNDAITQFTATVGGLLLVKDLTGRNIAVFQAVEKVGRALVAPALNLITPGLSKVSGDNQSGVSGVVLENPFVIELRDENISVLEGIPVTFTVIVGGGTLNTTHTTTDENGRAESTLTLGPNLGTTTVEVSAVGIERPVTFTAVAEAAVAIPDANLLAKIEVALGKASGEVITADEMKMLTVLNVNQEGIVDLTGLEFATKLTELWLERNAITDISPVAGLTNLTRLELGGNTITDISAVVGLIDLTRLGLWENNITDISAVSGLTNLIGLWLWDNNVTGISAVAGLTNLTWLNLAGNNITDISPLVANTGLGSGDTVYVRGNPLNYTSIKAHIPALQSREVDVKLDNRSPATPLKISGDDQQAAPGASLAQSLVVEVQDQRGRAFAGVPVTFSITAGSGTLGTTTTTTDANGRAESTLTLGLGAVTNTVNVSVEGVSETVTFTAIAGIEFDLSVPVGISLIHVPLKVTTVDGMAGAIESIGELYDALGGADTVNFLITYDSQAQDWLSYFVPADKGTPADATLTDDIGIIAGMKAPVSIRLSGDALGTNGTSTITLNQGLNLVGLPLRDSRITRVSDLFALEGIGGNVSVIILNDSGEFKVVGRAGDPGDIAITGGQAFILNARQTETVAIPGEAWTNVSETAAAPLVTRKGIKDTTPVLGLRGSVVDEEAGLKVDGFRVTVKHLSTGRAVAAVTAPEEADYRLTVVDIETGRAAMIGDTLEISAQSPHPLIGVKPLQYTVTAEDVKRSWIQLPALVAYEIPSETELLLNYPNPFNPETWVPYRLAEDAFVTLTIYDTVGQVVRTLDVGHRIASVYENRSKAIHWDGSNEVGERVASGMYFYTLTVRSETRAGDFSATRRMVIVK